MNLFPRLAPEKVHTNATMLYRSHKLAPILKSYVCYFLFFYQMTTLQKL